ncbi:bifunctional (p)ppGpp synthetase/guanosine-3',5'-bis(diphosphate) 3'-pyrophosphohydrolase [Rhodobacteraceae bacterium NNCM2]|nr:bifunctional (p)ppGpp synthetase/guanosine-3',5'-bis(diphosphate) 3'-pyrophosphohydrolase [Coraliihabitans acroporae]
MIRQFELVERVRDYNPNSNEALLNRAYVFGAKAHAHQRRANGEPYFGHPLEVAKILTDLHLDDASIVTALLHDTVEDTEATHDEIARLFGDEIANLVDGVTKLTRLELNSQDTAQAENFRKLLLAMARDVRVILVKLADRLHNMRTIGNLRQEKRERIARETMEIYAPLAGRMGMQRIREELEDLCFEVLQPEARTSIMRRFIKLRAEKGDLIQPISAEIEEMLLNSGLVAQVIGREKRPYSIWRKMEEKQTTFSQLSDIYAFRILCRTEDDCYRTLGAMHRNWRAVPGRFKDYISSPKANGYRSIHTTVYATRNRDAGAMRIEMQIRTFSMHAVAETGVAAHWAYKDGTRVENPFAVDPYHWLRELVERLEKGDEPEEFLEHVKLDMFTDQVFCFSPKGDVIGLPRGATPIDFAYAIHTRIGDRCAAALVDGRRVPLWTRLRNGQQVEIVVAEGQRPSPSWEDMAITGRAKAAIRRSLRSRLKAEQLALGRDLVVQSFARIGKEAGQKTLDTAAARLGMRNVDELLIALAEGRIASRNITEAVYPTHSAGDKPQNISVPEIKVRGIKRGQAMHFCTTCSPIPGDRIMGLTRKGQVVIHAISCPLLADFEDELERWHDLAWDPDANALPANLVRVTMTIANQPGTLGAVCTLVGDAQANISNIAITNRKPDFFVMTVELEVMDVKHLGDILASLRAQDFVNHVERSVGTQVTQRDDVAESQPRLPLGSQPDHGH